MDDAYELGILHPFYQLGGTAPDFVEELGSGRPFETRKLLLIHDAANADFFLGDGNEPEPFIFKADDNGIATAIAFIDFDAGKMAEDSDFFQARMHDSQAFLVAGRVAATAGIDEKRAAKGLGLPGFVAGGDADRVALVGEFIDCPAFAHLRAATGGMFQQQVVKFSAFDLDGLGFAGVTALAKDELGAFGAIAEMKLRAKFSGETGSLQGGHKTHFTKELVIVRQQ